MARKDPERAAKILSESGENVPGFEHVLSAWMRLDSMAALAWVEENHARNDFNQMDGAALGVLQFYSSQGNDSLGDQIEWLEKIQDENIRSTAEQIVHESRTNYLQNKIDENPPEAISMIRNRSGYFDLSWLERGIEMWYDSDPDGVNEWFGRQSDSLNSEELGYIATAFANKAIVANDPDSARQWLDFVNDEVARKLILERLNK